VCVCVCVLVRVCVPACVCASECPCARTMPLQEFLEAHAPARASPGAAPPEAAAAAPSPAPALPAPPTAGASILWPLEPPHSPRPSPNRALSLAAWHASCPDRMRHSSSSCRLRGRRESMAKKVRAESLPAHCVLASFVVWSWLWVVSSRVRTHLCRGRAAKGAWLLVARLTRTQRCSSPS